MLHTLPDSGYRGEEPLLHWAYPIELDEIKPGRNLMKHAFNALAVLLLTSGGIFPAMAEDALQTVPVHAPGLREQMRAIQFEQQTMAQHEHRSSQPQDPEHQAHEGNSDSASSQTPASGTEDASKGGKMSLEERRALRQQINEAGHEIYAPSH